jgi:hypothetical protein
MKPSRTRIVEQRVFEMMKWHYYVRPDSTAYWSTNPPHMEQATYLAYIMAKEQPQGTPFDQQQFAGGVQRS